MTLESQIESLTKQVERVADLLAAGTSLTCTTEKPTGSNPCQSKSGSATKTPAKTSASGSKTESETAPTEASTKAPSNPVVEEKVTEAKNLTATEVLEKTPAKPTPGTSSSEVSFSDISTSFFEYLAHAREKLGRDGAKTVARKMLDTFQSEKGKPLDVNFLAEDQYAEFHTNILAAIEAVTTDG